jgi:hypothetical protein
MVRNYVNQQQCSNNRPTIGKGFSITRQRTCKQTSAVCVTKVSDVSIARQRAVKKFRQQQRPCFLCGPWGDITTFTTESRVEAGSNTSTVTLRVVGGDEKGSLESETVKYGRESHGTRTRERLRWQGPAAIVNDRPVLSSERAPRTNPRLSDSNKNLAVSPR